MDMKEIDRRVKLGVRKIKISPLYLEGKTYNLETHKEDVEGTLRPDKTHCYITWESQWKDNDGVLKWSNEAFFCSTTEEAEEIKRYLKSK